MMKFLIIGIWIVLSSNNSLAQFTSIQQSINSDLEFTEISEANGVAIIGGAAVSKSIDAGFTWTEMNLGVFAFPFTIYSYRGAAIISSTEYCLIGEDNVNDKSIVIRTNDGGATWSNVLETANGSSNYFRDIHYNGSAVIVAAKGGVYRSANDGITWSWIAAGGTSQANAIQYNPGTNTWLYEMSNSNMRKSLDNGLTWLPQSVSFPVTGFVTQIGNSGNNFYVNKSQGAGLGGLVVMDAAYSFLDTITYTPFYTFNTAIEKAYFLPSNDVIASNIGLFCKIDVATGQFYYYDHNLVQAGGANLVQTNDFELGQTYGLAVGGLGGVSRFDLTQPEMLYLPATFSMTSVTCPGDTITATIDFTYADSVQWYYDGVLVSTDTSLIYPTQLNSFGQHSLVLQNWVGGNPKSSDTTFFNFAPLNPPAIFSFTGDVTTCYGTNAYISINYLTGATGNKTVDLWRDDLLLNSVTTGFASLSQWIYNVTEIDTILLVSSNQQLCGTSYDSITMIVFPTDDLSDNFNLLTNSSLICSQENSILNFSNIDSTNTYDMESSQGWSGSFPGGNNDSLNIIGPAIDLLPFPLASTIQYLPSYYEITISDTNGCSQGPFALDTFYVVRPTSQFSTLSPSYYVNDTLTLVNEFVRDNRSWDADQPLTVLNPSDTVPVIFGASTGFYSINLTNEPIPGCIDSSSQTILYCEPLDTNVLQTCWEKEIPNVYKIHSTKFDNEGNIYTLGAYRGYNTGYRPVFQLTKRNSDGDLIWQESGPSLNFYKKKAVITDFDFDNDGNLFCLFSIVASQSYNYQLINFTAINGSETSRSYLAKLNGQTGIMMWSQEISAMPELGNLYLHNTYDILVDNDLIYFTLASLQTLRFCCVDTAGNFVSKYQFNGTYQYRVNFLSFFGSSYTPADCLITPEFRKLPNGEIVIVGYTSNYGGGSTYIWYEGVPVPELGENATECILGAKYDPSIGLTDFTQLAQVPTGVNDFNFDIDQNSNITFACSWSDSYTFPVYIGDSLMSLANGTAVFQVNSDFDQNWLSIGNYSIYHEVDIAQATGEIFVSGKSHNNMALMTDTNSFMIGGYGPVIDPYPGYTLDYFIMTLSNSGIPTYGEFYGVSGINSNYSLSSYILPQSQLNTLVTPCGDVYPLFNRMFDVPLTDTFYLANNGVNIMLDSSIILKYSPSCSPVDCQYVSLQQGSSNFCTNSNVAFVDANVIFNVDSVSYNLLENGIVIDSATVPIDNGGFYVPIPTQNPSYQIAVFSPLIDTIEVYGLAVTAPLYTYPMDICQNIVDTILASPSINTFQWNNNSSTGDTYLFEASNYVVGLNEVEVTAIDTNGCIVNDTLEIIVNAVTYPSYTSVSVICQNDTDTIFASPALNTFEWNNNSSTGDNYIFEPSNYVVGLNEIDVVSIDTNGCIVNDTLEIVVNSAVVPLYTYPSGICQDDTVTILASPSINAFQWINNSSTGDNYIFEPSNYVVGLNEIDVVSIDTNGCVVNDTLEIIVSTPVPPTFNLNYLLPCSDELVILFNDADYTGITWYLNGSQIQNLFSQVNLTIGTNVVTVELVEQYCTTSYQIEIDYCADNSLEEYSSSKPSIYPNPTSRKLLIDAPDLNESVEFTIESSNGALIDVGTFDLSKPCNYDLTAPPGSYFITLKSEKYLYRYKLIKL